MADALSNAVDALAQATLAGNDTTALFREVQRLEQIEKENHMAKTTVPRIFVRVLADYNNGHYVDGWIDAAQDVEDLQHDVDQILARSKFGGEEWAIHDYDGFGPIKLDEYEPIEKIAALAKMLAEAGDPFVLQAFLAVRDEDVLEDLDALPELLSNASANVGPWESERDFMDECWLPTYGWGTSDAHITWEQIENTGLSSYLDYDRMFHELTLTSIVAARIQAKPGNNMYVFAKYDDR